MTASGTSATLGLAAARTAPHPLSELVLSALAGFASLDQREGWAGVIALPHHIRAVGLSLRLDATDHHANCATLGLGLLRPVDATNSVLSATGSLRCLRSTASSFS